MRDIIVIGGGGHAKVVISIIKKMRTFNILGYTDLADHGTILTVPYLGTDDTIIKHSTSTLLALGIGQLKDSDLRKSIVRNFIDKGYQFATLVSPDAIVNEDVSIGNGTVVMDGVVINAGSQIRDYCIINTKASIDHDCHIGNFVHIAPGTTLCGGVQVGDETFIGAGSVIVQYRKIAPKSFVKAHSLR